MRAEGAEVLTETSLVPGKALNDTRKGYTQRSRGQIVAAWVTQEHLAEMTRWDLDGSAQRL